MPLMRVENDKSALESAPQHRRHLPHSYLLIETLEVREDEQPFPACSVILYTWKACRVYVLSTYVAGTGDHNKTFVRCLGAFLLWIPFERGSGEMHRGIGAIRIDVIISCVFAHREADPLTEGRSFGIKLVIWMVLV